MSPDIRIEHLSKAYGEKKVLSDFSAVIPCGSAAAVMGPSGCGKTTLLRILMGLETPDGGTIAGMPETFSAVFQEDRLCEGATARKNIEMILPKGHDRKIARRHLEMAGLGDSVDQPVRFLSGGMKRRTAIVRACLAETPLILMDEPFRELDQKTRQQMMDYVKEMTRGRTLILVTHDPGEAETFGDQIIRL